MTHSGITKRFTLIVAAIGFCGTLSAIQPPAIPPDRLAEARARHKVANEKAEADVLTAIQDADRLAKSSTVKAVRVLKTAQVMIDLSPALSGDTRKTLTAMIEGKIAQLEGRPIPQPAPTSPAAKYNLAAAFESYKAELKAVNDVIESLAKDKQAGRTKEAEREIAALAKSYPNNPAVIRLQVQDALEVCVEDAKEMVSQQDRRIRMAFRPIGGRMPASGDVEFPESRKWTGPGPRNSWNNLTEKEKKLLESLNKPVTVNWSGKMLEDALEELSSEIEQKFVIDKKSLSDLGIDWSKAVNLEVKKASARTVLRQLLGAQRLTFFVKDDVIQVVMIERAREVLVTRIYYLGDVVGVVGPVGSSVRGMFLDFEQTMRNVDVIVKSIQESVDPLCWKANGGPCTLAFHYPSMSMIVRASAEVHLSLGKLPLGSKDKGGR